MRPNSRVLVCHPAFHRKGGFADRNLPIQEKDIVAFDVPEDNESVWSLASIEALRTVLAD